LSTEWPNNLRPHNPPCRRSRSTKSGSHQTRRWSKVDSNSRSHVLSKRDAGTISSALGRWCDGWCGAPFRVRSVHGGTGSSNPLCSSGESGTNRCAGERRAPAPSDRAAARSVPSAGHVADVRRRAAAAGRNPAEILILSMGLCQGRSAVHRPQPARSPILLLAQPARSTLATERHFVAFTEPFKVLFTTAAQATLTSVPSRSWPGLAPGFLCFRLSWPQRPAQSVAPRAVDRHRGALKPRVLAQAVATQRRHSTTRRCWCTACMASAR